VEDVEAILCLRGGEDEALDLEDVAPREWTGILDAAGFLAVVGVMSIRLGFICLARLEAVELNRRLLGDRVALRDLSPLSTFSLPGDSEPL